MNESEIKKLQRRIELQESLVSVKTEQVLNREAMLTSAKESLAGEQDILESMKRQLSLMEAHQTLHQVNNN